MMRKGYRREAGSEGSKPTPCASFFTLSKRRDSRLAAGNLKSLIGYDEDELDRAGNIELGDGTQLLAVFVIALKKPDGTVTAARLYAEKDGIKPAM